MELPVRRHGRQFSPAWWALLGLLSVLLGPVWHHHGGRGETGGHSGGHSGGHPGDVDAVAGSAFAAERCCPHAGETGQSHGDDEPRRGSNEPGHHECAVCAAIAEARPVGEGPTVLVVVSLPPPGEARIISGRCERVSPGAARARGPPIGAGA